MLSVFILMLSMSMAEEKVPVKEGFKTMDMHQFNKGVMTLRGPVKSMSERNQRDNLESAIEMLKTGGFNSSDISVLMSDKQDTRNFAHENSTKAPEGTATGAASGAVLGVVY